MPRASRRRPRSSAPGARGSSGPRRRSGARPALRHVRVQQDQPRGVPQLVGEVASLLDAVRGEADVLARRHRQQAEAQGVGAVDLDLVQRVDPGAERLRHPPAVGGLDDGVDVDVVERDLAGELEPHHDHPRDPEEDDVAGRGEEVGRVERREQRIVGVGPAERRERPQRRGEPGVEHVLLAAQLTAACTAAIRRLLLDDVDLLAGVAVPDRDLVPPPELARDAPGPDVLHPVEVDALPLLGRDPHLVALDDLDRRLGQLVHPAEPLQGDQRLDPLAGAVRERDRVRVLLLGAEQALLPERGDHRLLGLGGGHSRVLARVLVHPAVLADHRDLLEPVLAPDLEVVDVVAGRDLERAGPELGVDVVVGDDRQPAAPPAAGRRACRPAPGSARRPDSPRRRCRRASSPGAPWRP